MSWSPRSYSMNAGTHGLTGNTGGVDSALARPTPGAGLPVDKTYGEKKCKTCRRVFTKKTWNQDNCEEHTTRSKRLKNWKG